MTEAITIRTGAIATPDDAAKVAELHRALRVATLRLTTAADWVDMDGRPYLSASGCQRLAPLFRIRTRNVRTERVEDGTGYTIVVTGEAASDVLDPDGWQEVVGSASSADPFLTRGGRVVAAYGDVLKKAHTNFLARAIKQVIGLGGITWDDLAQHGISRANVPQITHASPDKASWVPVQIPYQHRETFRGICRKVAGISPLWDGQNKAWRVPPGVAEHPEVRALTEAPKTDAAQPPLLEEP